MTLREYRAEDFGACVAMVNQVWEFDRHLQPASLAQFVMRMYTGGPLAESRYYTVVEDDGRVQGLLFGRCGPGAQFHNEYSQWRGQLRTARKFISLPGLGIHKKLAWLRAISAHEAARRRIQPHTEGEITLLVVHPASQGKGYGKQLMDAYVNHCRSAGEKRLTVETDVESNYGFYDHYGFVLIGDFASPMNQLYNGGTGESFVYEFSL